MNGACRAAAVLAAVCGAAACLVADEPNKPHDPVTSRTLVYLGPGGPVRIRVDGRIGGRPVDAVWSEAVEALFTFADRNGDGVLEGPELTPFLATRRDQELELRVAGAALFAPVRLDIRGKDAKVSRAQFAQALRDAGQAPISMTVASAQPQSARLSAVLFRRLDRDGDGRLNAEELNDTRDRLALYDVDEDECISAGELLGRAADAANPVNVLQRAPVPQSAESAGDLLLLDGDAKAAAKQLLATRGTGRTQAVRLKDLQHGSTLAAFDKNGDGTLDASELEAWLREPPKADYVFDVYTQVDGKGVTDIPHSTSKLASLDYEFDLNPFGLAGVQARTAWKSRAGQLQQQLTGVADPKGEIPREKLPSQPELQALFDFADRNADSRLESAELSAALQILGRLAGCRIIIAVTDKGNGLFELLDGTGDGKLTPRELHQAWDILKPFADNKGRVDPSRLPRRFVVANDAATIPAVVSFPLPAPVSAAAKLTVVPEWFSRMDRNGDGEISLREFLGPVELFKKLDHNADGLIDGQETRRQQPN